MQRITDWSRRKVIRPLQAMSRWEQVATLVVGVLGGLLPIPALTTLVTLALCGMLRFNAAQSGVATAINLALTAVELAAIPVFAQLGAVVTGVDADSFTAAVIIASMREGVASLLTNASSMIAHACLTWALLTAVGMILLALSRPARREGPAPLLGGRSD